MAQEQLNRIRYNAFLLPALIGPAVFFSFIWGACNQDIRYIGEGLNGSGSCFMAGLICWLWLARFFWCRADSGGVPSTSSIATWIATQFAVLPFSIFAGRVIFSFIPPWRNDLGAIVGLLTGGYITQAAVTLPTSKYVTQRGTVLLSDTEADRRSSLLEKTSEPPIRWAGREYPAEVSFGNIVVAGGVGAGKTLMHRELMTSALPQIKPGSGRMAIIYDVKSDLIAELHTMNLSCEVLIFNPFDRRSVAWNIAQDLDTPARARQFSHALIPQGEDEDGKFFANAARSVITGIINGLNRRKAGLWSLRDVINITADKQLMESLLGPTSRLVKQFFHPDKTFSNVINEIATVTTALEPVAALWEQTTKRQSLRDWVKRGDSILVLGGNDEHREALQVLNRTMLKLITAAFFTLEESPTKTRMWFFCDELADAGRLDGLPALLNARSKGVRCVLGFQDFEGLFIGYDSHDKAKAIIGKCDTISWLRISTDETAEWASKRSGKVERLEYMESRGKDGTTVGEHLAERDAIMASQFMSLPPVNKGIVEGFHMIRGMGGILKGRVEYKFKTLDKTENLIERPKGTTQELAEWNDADGTRLGIGSLAATLTSASPDARPTALNTNSQTQDIDDIPRVHFH